ELRRRATDLLNTMNKAKADMMLYLTGNFEGDFYDFEGEFVEEVMEKISALESQKALNSHNVSICLQGRELEEMRLLREAIPEAARGKGYSQKLDTNGQKPLRFSASTDINISVASEFLDSNPEDITA